MHLRKDKLGERQTHKLSNEVLSLKEELLDLQRVRIDKNDHDFAKYKSTTKQIR